MTHNVLAEILGRPIAQASATLPDAETASNEPHHAEIELATAGAW